MAESEQLRHRFDALAHPGNVALSREIERFINVHTTGSVTEHEQTSEGSFDTLNVPIVTSAAFTTKQLDGGIDILLAQGFDVPSEVVFARVLPSTEGEVHANPLYSRGLTYGALFYPQTALVYGGLLNRERTHAAYIHKRTIDLVHDAGPDSFEVPNGEATHNRQRLARSIREMGQWFLGATGTLRPIPKRERHLLRALLAVES